MRKFIYILLTIIIVLAILLPLTAFILVQNTFTTVDGTVRLKGLRSAVEIYRDEWGVPHIYADNEADLFFAQGYVQAQDRLWQLELHRRMGSGTLSEIFGGSTLEMDRFSRAVGLRRLAAANYRQIDAEMRVVLDAFAGGVNAFIQNNSDHLPLEFTLLGFRPAPWEPADSLTIANLISWDLSKNWETELLRARLVRKLGIEKAMQLLCAYPDNRPVVVPETTAKYPLGDVQAVHLLLSYDGAGSNNWVIDGSKSATGKPILANDPHLLVMMPAIWYETGLHGAGINVAGVSLPGCPLIIIGRNEDIAWGSTNLPADVQDLFIEKINPVNPLQYEYMGKWEDMQVIDEQIKVRGKDKPDLLSVRITRHGPLLDNVVPGLEQPLALKWTGNRESSLLRGAYLLDKAGDWDQFRQALKLWDAPAQNIVYADNRGNIGYQSTGRIPVRAKGQGIVPSPGWSGEYEWTSYIPYDEMPRVLNPPCGFVASANNKVEPPGYPYLLGYDWSPPYRAQRIVDLIQARDKLTVQDIRDIHADVFDIPASLLVPYMRNASTRTDQEKQAVELLKSWDCMDRADSAAAAVFHVCYVKLLWNTLRDELGEKLLLEYLKPMGGTGDVHAVFMEGIIGDNSNPWFDDIDTPQVETRDDIIRKSLSEAVDELSRQYGYTPAQWEWGKLHTTHFQHVLGMIPQLGVALSRGPVPTPGSRYTVNVAAFDYFKPYGVSAIPSYRQIIDWSNPGSFLAIHSTGQSGLPFASHYDDMIARWLNVEYQTMYVQKQDVVGHSRSLLKLEPVGTGL